MRGPQRGAPDKAGLHELDAVGLDGTAQQRRHRLVDADGARRIVDAAHRGRQRAVALQDLERAGLVDKLVRVGSRRVVELRLPGVVERDGDRHRALRDARRQRAGEIDGRGVVHADVDPAELLNRLGDILRRRILKGDRAAEQTLENTLETLSELYIKSNRLQNAEPTLRELIAIREKTKGPDDHILGKTLAEYSNVLKSLGRSEEASKHEQKANIILNQLSAH